MSREEARERFRRIAASRANKIIENLRLLAHCADRKNYEYDQEQVNTIFSAISQAVEETRSKFVTRGIRRIEL